MKAFKQLFLIVLLVCALTGSASAAEKYLRIGSASIGSGFYQVAGGIAQL